MNSRQQFISDEEVEKALDYLRDSAAEIGDLTYEAVRSEKMTKHLVAIEMKKHDTLSAAAQLREAQASPAFETMAMLEAKAAGELAKAKALREAASAKIEAWRTSCSNFRSMKI